MRSTANLIHPSGKLRWHVSNFLIVSACLVAWQSVLIPSAFADFATSNFPARGLSTAPAAERNLEDLLSAKQTSDKIPNVARVSVEQQSEVSLGSGTLVGVQGEHGFVLTNWHVVRDAKENIFVSFPDGFRSAATVMKTDDEWDLALLLIWKPAASPMPLAPALPQAGQPLTIAGYGQGSFRAQRGKMTEVVSPNETSPFEMIEVSATARQGDSGGPIINDQGQLAAVLFGSGGGRTTGTRVDRVRMFLDSAFAPPDDEMYGNQRREQIASNGPGSLRDPGHIPQHPVSLNESVPDSMVDVQLPPDAYAESGNQAATDPFLSSSQPQPPPLTESNEPPPDMRVATLAALQNIPMARSCQGRGEYNGYAAGAYDGVDPNSPVAVQQWSGHNPANTPLRRHGPTPFSELKSFFAVVGIFAAAFLLLPR